MFKLNSKVYKCVFAQVTKLHTAQYSKNVRLSLLYSARFSGVFGVLLKLEFCDTCTLWHFV